MAKLVARLGDTSTHGGAITGGTSSKHFAEGAEIALDGCTLSCPIHGPVSVVATAKNTSEGAKIVRDGDVASCGAVIISGATKVFSN